MTLSARHLNELTGGSAIDEVLVKEREYRTLRWSPSRPKPREYLRGKGISDWALEGRTGSGLYIPIWNVVGENGYCQWKPTTPVTDAKGKVRKYISPTGPKSLDVHPCNTGRLKDVADALWITEGIKKADSLSSRGKCVVGLTGVDGWRDSVGPLGDWSEIALKGRKVVLCFDADSLTNSQVRRALASLGQWLKTKGCVLHYVIPPATVDNVEVKGVDDYFAAGGEIRALVKRATRNPPVDAKVRAWERGKLVVEKVYGMDAFRPPEMTVQRLIAPGATLFSAGKKVGKSLLSTHIGLQVVRGAPVFGELTSRPGRVLYLCGEDKIQLVTWRMGALLAVEMGLTFSYDDMSRAGVTHYTTSRVTDEARSEWRSDRAAYAALNERVVDVRRRGFDIVTDFPRLDQGLIDYIRGWIASDDSSASLVVIDHLTLIQGERRKEQNLVKFDYETTRVIEDMSQETGVASLVIAHMPKAEHSDLALRVSGSGGLTAPVSNILSLGFEQDRSDTTRVIELASRIIDSSGVLRIHVKRGEKIRLLDGDIGDIQTTNEAILSALRNRRMAPRAVSDVSGLDYHVVKKALQRLWASGAIQRAQGVYWLSDDS